MSNEERLEQLINELQLIMKDLGVATAYGYAVEKGYTGTEEEFAELMASYATVAQDAAHSAEQAAESATNAHNSEINAGTSESHAEQSKLDAQAAKTAAETAQGKAEEAQGKAETAEGNADTHAEDSEAWAVGTRDGSPVGQTDPTYHNNAKYYAELADTKADQAADSASDASDAKDTAVSAKNAAVDAKDIAVSAKNDAVDAKDAAVSAKNDAELAETGAVNAKNDAIDAKDAAVTAKTDAQTAKDQAVSAKNDAVTAKTDAQTAKDQAVTAKNDAQTAKDQAVSAKNDAVTAKNGAVDAKDAAQAAQAAAEEAATHVADMALMQAIAPKYNSATAYKVGDLLTYLGKQYEVTGDDGVAPPVGTLPTDTHYFTERPVSEVIEELETGKRPVGKANLANNFDSKMVLTDNSGYLYRTTGGSLEVGEQNRVKKIIGASVPIIQTFDKDNISFSGCTKTVSGSKITLTASSTATWTNYYSGSITFTNGHKYALFAKASKRFLIAIGDSYQTYASGIVHTIVISSNANNTTRLFPFNDGAEENETQVFDYFFLIDLTQTFGTAVANRLYALEQAQAGTGIAKAKEILVKDYYPYNVTAFTHTKTSGKVNNGFNQWDEQWELGTYNYNTGEKDSSTQFIRSKNKIECEPSTVYYFQRPATTSTSIRLCFYDSNQTFIEPSNWMRPGTFTTPSNAHYLTFATVGTTYENNICINLHWDGERDGEYEDYQEWNYPVQDIELKGILSLDAQDNWVADGDEYLPSGVVDGKYRDRTIPSNGTKREYTNIDYYQFQLSDAALSFSSKSIDSPYYTSVWGVSEYDNASYVGCVMYASSTYAFIGFSKGTSLEDMVTAITSKNILYKLATPTTSSADPYTELQNDSNWGTEKWIDTRDVPMPVFSTCEYIPDLKAKLETAPESPDEDGDYIMHRENGLNSYGSLSTWLSENGYNKMQDLLTSFGANGMVGGTLRQQLAVAKSIDFLDTKCVNMGDLTYNIPGGVETTSTLHITVLSDAEMGTNVLCTMFKTSTTNPISEGCLYFSDSYYGVRTMAFRTAISMTNAEFKEYVKGQLIAYKKATT